MVSGRPSNHHVHNQCNLACNSGPYRSMVPRMERPPAKRTSSWYVGEENKQYHLFDICPRVLCGRICSGNLQGKFVPGSNITQS